MMSSWAMALRTISDWRIAPAACAASPAMKPTMQCRPPPAGDVGEYEVTQNSGTKQSAACADRLIESEFVCLNRVSANKC